MNGPKAFVVLTALAGSVLLAGTIASAPAPRTISVGGTLSDATGTPIEGEYTFQVDFYGADTTTPIDTLKTAVTLTAGTFNVEVPTSDALLENQNVTYRVSVDLDRNGLTTADLFPDVFKLTPVLRSYRADPADRLKGTFTGAVATYALATPDSPHINLSLLDVPPTGLHFNTMMIKAYSNTAPVFQNMDETHYEVGVYGADGNLVVKSRSPLRFSQSTASYVQVVVPESYLPQGDAYAAFSADIKSPNQDRFIRYLPGVTNTDFFTPPNAETVYAGSGVLPDFIGGIKGRTTPQVGPAVTLQYLPEAEGLVIGAYRRSDVETTYSWVNPAGSFF